MIPKDVNGLLPLGTVGPSWPFRPWDESSFKGFFSQIVETIHRISRTAESVVGHVFLLIPALVCYLSYLIPPLKHLEPKSLGVWRQ